MRALSDAVTFAKRTIEATVSFPHTSPSEEISFTDLTLLLFDLDQTASILSLAMDALLTRVGVEVYTELTRSLSE